MTPDDVLTALREFVARIDAFDPQAPPCGEVEVRLALRTPVAEALVAALRAYHDPRDLGRCAHCGSLRLDENFLCRDCGGLNGLFGRMIAERAARTDHSPG
jgi:hypothetical protein